MQRTENYRLFKPESTDNGSPEPFNSNADTIDAELNRLSTGLSRVDNALVASQAVLESGITSAKVSKLDALPTNTQLDESLSNKANKSDITNISIAGTTNNTGSNILAGTLFYLNGALYKTLVDVANGATFTVFTNCVPWSLKNIQDMLGEYISTGIIPGKLAIDKIGRLCIIRTIVNITIPSGSYQPFAIVIEEDLPSRFRPIGYNRSFVVSNTKNIYSLEILSESNKLRLLVWAGPITVGDNENIQFSMPYFTND